MGRAKFSMALETTERREPIISVADGEGGGSGINGVIGIGLRRVVMVVVVGGDV